MQKCEICGKTDVELFHKGVKGNIKFYEIEQSYMCPPCADDSKVARECSYSFLAARVQEKISQAAKLAPAVPDKEALKKLKGRKLTMGDMGEVFRQMRKETQITRGNRRGQAPDFLSRQGVQFSIHNNGAHLIVEGPYGKIDFWPGTTKWICRSGKRNGYGIKTLLRYVNTATKSTDTL